MSHCYLPERYIAATCNIIVFYLNIFMLNDSIYIVINNYRLLERNKLYNSGAVGNS